MSARPFAFLRELAENNDRARFEANIDRYERDVREASHDSIEEVGPLVDRISPHFVSDPCRSLLRIREAMVADPAAWRRASRLKGDWLHAGDSLKSAPRGFDPEHPLVEDLKRKDFIATRGLTEEGQRFHLPA